MPYKYKEDKKKYHKEYHAKWYEKNRSDVILKQKERKTNIKEWFKNYKKNLSCEKCGENHPATLDFHHKDPSKKDGLVSRHAGLAHSKERIMEEIAKCDVLCANCHRKLHWVE